ncbi:MAG: HesA/MoeB/ThiF family protein, partial [Armatimonadota bacterium]
MILSPEDRERFDRHFRLPQVGESGQARLRKAKVLVVGAGGLGSPVLAYLAAAGIGELTVLDDDRVSLSNLQRQILHGTPDVGRSKVDSAGDRIHALDPAVAFHGHRVRLTTVNARDWVRAADVVVNCADNFETRYALGDAAVREGVPMVHGAVHRFQGEVALFPPDGPCYRCLHPVPPIPGTVASCDEAGVLGVLPGVIGCLQASETIKYLLKIGDPMSGRVVAVDLLAGSFHEMRLEADPRCPFHGTGSGV